MATFAEILKARIDADPDLTEAGLAVKAGLDNSTVRRIIANGRNPRVDTAERICRALGITLEEFMGNPQSDEERDILRLVSELPAPLRRKLLAYAEGLRAAADPADD